MFTARASSSVIPLARRHKPDLVIMDTVLPRMDGIGLMRLLRQESDVPVIFLTHRKKEVDSLLAFSHGADDYVTKPFRVSDLLARIKAVLHRTAPQGSSATGSIFVGDLELDMERRGVRVKRKQVALAPKEFELLKLLVTTNGKALSRTFVLETLWGFEKGQEVSTRTVDQHVARLRRKLRSEGRRILLVRNFGYQFKML